MLHVTGDPFVRIVLYYPSYIYDELDSGSSDWGCKIGVMTVLSAPNPLSIFGLAIRQGIGLYGLCYGRDGWKLYIIVRVIIGVWSSASIQSFVNHICAKKGITSTPEDINNPGSLSCYPLSISETATLIRRSTTNTKMRQFDKINP